MTSPRLKTLVVENFRSLRGKVVVPLDAQVVLIHGSNGMGKTSVLSALELGLTGKIAHLASQGDEYRRYLTTFETEGGSIDLTTTAALHEGARDEGSLNFGHQLFDPKPLLGSDEARFFAERCYLPQAALGRLLEIYDDQSTGTTSWLTQFVKELLRLDPLDALVDGLYPAFNVARVRNLVPQYRRLETLKASLVSDVSRLEQSLSALRQSSLDRRTQLSATLTELFPDATKMLNENTDLHRLETVLETANGGERVLSDLARTRSELSGLTQRWQSLPSEDLSRDQASTERQHQSAVQALSAWRSVNGRELENVIGLVRAIAPNLPVVDDGPDKSRTEAERWARAEAKRCSALVNAAMTAAEQVKILDTTIQRASDRISELNSLLARSAENARSLADALAGIAPHVSGEICPVCDRDFAELHNGPLSAHIGAKLALLTGEAGRLQSIANERAEESSRLAVAQRDLLSATSGQLSAEEYADLSVRAAQMSSAAEWLKTLIPAAEVGTRLMKEADSAAEAVRQARRRADLSKSLVPEIEIIIQSATQQPASNFASIDEALKQANRTLVDRIGAAERLISLRIRAISELDLYKKNLDQIGALIEEKKRLVARRTVVEKAESRVDQCRQTAKKIADSTNSVRSTIVKRVFNTALNKIWRDLFVRLAPSEQFVPAFRLPTSNSGKVEAVLETLHRSGKSSGSPGAMLSQGNLNTAALTLFLALHLSVPSRMPWLVLDDPVQSMDDVHTAQFAALLRTLSKGMGRQLIVAVHERALFDYLTLELSPAFSGDSLICVELSRNFSGEAVATPRSYSFESDTAIAS